HPHLKKYPVKAFEGKLISAYENQDVFDYTHFLKFFMNKFESMIVGSINPTYKTPNGLKKLDYVSAVWMEALDVMAKQIEVNESINPDEVHFGGRVLTKRNIELVNIISEIIRVDYDQEFKSLGLKDKFFADIASLRPRDIAMYRSGEFSMTSKANSYSLLYDAFERLLVKEINPDTYFSGKYFKTDVVIPDPVEEVPSLHLIKILDNGFNAQDYLDRENYDKMVFTLLKSDHSINVSKTMLSRDYFESNDVEMVSFDLICGVEEIVSRIESDGLLKLENLPPNTRGKASKINNAIDKSLYLIEKHRRKKISSKGLINEYFSKIIPISASTLERYRYNPESLAFIHVIEATEEAYQKLEQAVADGSIHEMKFSDEFFEIIVKGGFLSLRHTTRQKTESKHIPDWMRNIDLKGPTEILIADIDERVSGMTTANKVYTNITDLFSKQDIFGDINELADALTYEMEKYYGIKLQPEDILSQSPDLSVPRKLKVLVQYHLDSLSNVGLSIPKGAFGEKVKGESILNFAKKMMKSIEIGYDVTFLSDHSAYNLIEKLASIPEGVLAKCEDRNYKADTEHYLNMKAFNKNGMIIPEDFFSPELFYPSKKQAIVVMKKLMWDMYSSLLEKDKRIITHDRFIDLLADSTHVRKEILVNYWGKDSGIGQGIVFDRLKAFQAEINTPGYAVPTEFFMRF
ncbi:hypothetical protein HQ529_03465, partial [Candidatus Woesearchaeota archaeon]|nr:hypothetical protein [Candidatus Woesearchaeota archaeon]